MYVKKIEKKWNPIQKSHWVETQESTGTSYMILTVPLTKMDRYIPMVMYC